VGGQNLTTSPGDITYHFPINREDINVKTFARFFTAFLIALILDGLTKIWAVQTFEPYQPMPVIGDFFRLTLGYNTGVGFSMFTDTGWWPLLMTGVIIVGLAVWMVYALRSGELPLQAAWPLGFILGGAAANFIDRLMDRHVVDFLDFGLRTTRWPAFNLADSFIVVGVAWLLLIKMQALPDKESGETLSEGIEPE
jgi:signal peptidase II